MQELDFEVELAIVIGKSARRVPARQHTTPTTNNSSIQAARALDHVFGFTVAHDVSARDWQLKRNGGQWLLGKVVNREYNSSVSRRQTFDTFAPIGPAIVSTDELGDPHKV